MDTFVDSNVELHKSLSTRLYGGDDQTRIRQEYVLGVGGVALFDHLEGELNGPHLNEGHCTFAMLELLHRGWSREQLAKIAYSLLTHLFQLVMIDLNGFG